MASLDQSTAADTGEQRKQVQLTVAQVRVDSGLSGV